MARVSFTTKGYIEVWRGERFVSRHRSETEAVEAVFADAAIYGDGEYTLRYPGKIVRVIGTINPNPGGDDVTAPSIPGNLVLFYATAVEVAFGWDVATDNVAVTGYQIFRDDAAIATTTETNYIDTGLTPGTQYTYNVAAFDAAGNNDGYVGQTPLIVTTEANSAPVWTANAYNLTVGNSFSLDLNTIVSNADVDPLTFTTPSPLPTGLTYNASTETISGTPTNADNTVATVVSVSDGIYPAVQNTITFTVLNADTTAPPVPTINTPTDLAANSMTVTCSTVTDTTAANAYTSGTASYTLQRATDSGFTQNVVTATPQASTTWNVTGLAADTTYYFRVRATDSAGNASAYSSSTSAATIDTEWLSVPAPVFTQGTASSYDLTQHLQSGGVLKSIQLVSGTLPEGVTIDDTSGAQALDYDGVGPVATATGIVLSSTDSAEADWISRTQTGPYASGVVWYHDFRSDNEVNVFRWSNGWQSGNDPNGLSTSGSGVPSWLRRITNDGMTGGGCLEVFRAAGSQDSSLWWRPFAPLVGGATSGNGRGVGNDDPAANGSLTRRTFTPTSGGNQTAQFGRKGFYGRKDLYDLTGSEFDGTEFYLQYRIKVDPRRSQSGNPTAGKHLWITHTAATNSTQQIFPHSLCPQRTAGLGTPQYMDGEILFNTYQRWYSVNLNGLAGDNPGSTWAGATVGDGVCELFSNTGGKRANCWYYSLAGWNTVMFHIIPGTINGTDHYMKVYAAWPGETEYTLVYDIRRQGSFSDNTNSATFHAPGYNSIALANYQNNQASATDFWHRFDQIILSKSWIPCPQDSGISPYG